MGVQSAMAPPEIVSAPVRLADAPPVMHVSAPPPVFAEPPLYAEVAQEPIMGGTVTMAAPPQQPYAAQTYAAPPVTYAAHMEPQHVTAQPLEMHTYAAPMTTSITMAAPPLTYTTQQMQGAPVLYQHVVA